jgi:hypothetical protein
MHAVLGLTLAAACHVLAAHLAVEVWGLIRLLLCAAVSLLQAAPRT